MLGNVGVAGTFTLWCFTLFQVAGMCGPSLAGFKRPQEHLSTKKMRGVVMVFRVSSKHWEDLIAFTISQ
jgi:hypothetical protein